MPDIKINASQLTDAIQEALDEVRREANKACDETVDEISKEVLKEVKDNAPVRTGAYKKSIKRKKTKKTENDIEYTIYSETPNLPHLLEHGHQTVNGGRTRAFPHFSKGQELANQRIEEEFKKKFKA